MVAEISRKCTKHVMNYYFEIYASKLHLKNFEIRDRAEGLLTFKEHRNMN